MVTTTEEQKYAAEVGRIEEQTAASLLKALDDANTDVAELGLRTEKKASLQSRIIPVTAPKQILVPYTSPRDAVALSRHLAEADNDAVKEYLKDATPQQLYETFLRAKLHLLSMRQFNFPGGREAEALAIHNSISGLFGDKEPSPQELLAYPRITTNVIADLCNFLALSNGRFDELAKWARGNETAYLSELFPDKAVKTDDVKIYAGNPFYRALRAIFRRRPKIAPPVFESGLGHLTTVVLAASEKLSGSDYGLKIPKDARKAADRLARQIEDNLPDKKQWPYMARRSAELIKEFMESRDGLDYVIGDPTRSMDGSLEYVLKQREKDAPSLYVDGFALRALGDAAKRKPAFTRSAKSAFAVGDGEAERLFYRNLADIQPPLEIEPAEVVVGVNPAPAPGYRDIPIIQTMPRDIVLIPQGQNDLSRATSLAIAYAALRQGSMVSIVSPDEAIYTTDPNEVEQRILKTFEDELTYGTMEAGLAARRKPLGIVIVADGDAVSIADYLVGRMRPKDKISVIYTGRGNSGEYAPRVAVHKLESLDSLRGLRL